MDELLGRVLREKYRVEKVLGSGGMGVVVLATHLRMSQRVAIKVLRAEAKHRDDIVRRFAREARAASKLRGEHAVRILDVDESDAGDPFLVMEYLDGADLQRLLADDGPMPLDRAVTWLLQVCEGVAEAHAAGIVHRDLKPANLFVTKRPDGSALIKLLDFGISKIDEPDHAEHGITRPQTAIGSPSYMAPEQIRNAADADARTDVWALGVVFFQMLTTTLPFAADTTAALSLRIAVDPPASLLALRPDLDSRVEDVIARCLAKNPADRFPSVGEFAEALATLLDGAESAALRVKRVLAHRSPKDTPIPPTTGGSQKSPPSHGPMTQSIVESDRGRPPLAGAVVTEYASAIGTTHAPDGTAKSSERPRRRMAIAGVVGALVATAVLGWVASRARNTPTAPEQHSSAVSVRATEEIVAPPAPTVIETVSSPASASVHPDAAPPRSNARPAAPQAPAKKNPMDLDFR